MKFLKQGKRCDLGSKRLEKQAVCHTHACLEKGRLLRESKILCKTKHKDDAVFGWEEADAQFELDIAGWLSDRDKHDLPVRKVQHKRAFKGKIEDWEREVT